jgi:hypothetical protein
VSSEKRGFPASCFATVIRNTGPAPSFLTISETVVFEDDTTIAVRSGIVRAPSISFNLLRRIDLHHLRGPEPDPPLTPCLPRVCPELPFTVDDMRDSL